MPKVPDHPYFVSDHMLKVLDRPYFVPDRMFFRSKVLDRPHFVLDCMLSRGYFSLHFTFSMTWGY
ncbi:hypothetical protein AMTRI_Chr03g50880 [Amborella trichopoda]